MKKTTPKTSKTTKKVITTKTPNKVKHARISPSTAQTERYNQFKDETNSRTQNEQLEILLNAYYELKEVNEKKNSYVRVKSTDLFETLLGYYNEYNNSFPDKRVVPTISSVSRYFTMNVTSVKRLFENSEKDFSNEDVKMNTRHGKNFKSWIENKFEFENGKMKKEKRFPVVK